MSGLRRSCLSVPGGVERMLDKAPGLGADELVLDLEDSVAAEQKPLARRLVVQALRTPNYADVQTAVRVNGIGTAWCHEDLLAVASADVRPRSVVVPKVESAGDLAFVDRLLDGVERACGLAVPLRVQALIESAAGLVRIQEIAAASPRLEALILGYADLAADLGRSAEGVRDTDGWRAAQDAVIVAACANRLQAIDGPWLGTAVDADFRAAAMRVREAGFDGKWAIHPAQVHCLAELFTPSQGEVERARAVIAALDRAAREGLGAVALDGQMLDEAVRVGAQRILVRAGRSS